MNYTQHVSTGIKNAKGREVLVAIQAQKEGTMVALKPLFTSIGLSWNNKLTEKIQDNPAINCALKRMVGKDGRCSDRAF